jgi:phage-related protein
MQKMATLFEMSAILRLDHSAYDRDLRSVESETNSVGSKIGNIFSKLGTVGKVGIAALGASFTAVSAAVGKSIKEYADYEQLWGGVQKLYGTAGKSIEEYAKSVGKSVDEVRADYGNLEKAQNLMLKQANEAYKTSGVSANKYMEQATSFSASLINSLNGDTVKAAKQTDVAMRAISDNFNTFGGDIDMISYSFQGFAKQNFTMLDNLKLGYGKLLYCRSKSR